MSGLRDTESILPLISPLHVGVLETSHCVESSAWVCDKTTTSREGKKGWGKSGETVAAGSMSTGCIRLPKEKPWKEQRIGGRHPVFRASRLPQVVLYSFHAGK